MVCVSKSVMAVTAMRVSTRAAPVGESWQWRLGTNVGAARSKVPFLANGLDPRGSVDICTLTVMRQVCRSQLVQCDYVQVTRKGTRKIATRAHREMNDLSL